MYETLLFLHVLSTFVLVASIGLCWAIYAGGGSLVRLGAVVFPVPHAVLEYLKDGPDVR